MPLPLYKELQAPQNPGIDAHIGLWFERYFSAYAADFSAVDEDTRKTWLKTCQRQQGNSDHLQGKAAQTLQRVRSFGGDARVYHCAGRFATGIGNAHPMENGFSWHPTLGMPYLPGSAVKGLVRAVIETALDADKTEKDSLLKLWFGTAAKDDVAEQAGAFVFLDSLPTSPCEIKAEVLTPHMGKWYEKGGKDPLKADTMPGDWHSPVPVLWLAASNLKLQFAVMPRPGAAPVAMDDLWQTLEYGLQNLGAGAKTAIGYGQFILSTLAEQEQQQIERKLEKQSEIHAEDQRKKSLAAASEQQRQIIELSDYIATLPDKIPASDQRFAVLWQQISESIELISNSGSAEEKAQLLALIKGARDRKFIISSKKEKDFKALLAKLSN